MHVFFVVFLAFRTSTIIISAQFDQNINVLFQPQYQSTFCCHIVNIVKAVSHQMSVSYCSGDSSQSLLYYELTLT